MGRQTIRCIRKGSVQWNEEDRLQLANLLVKCGYAVRLNHKVVSGQSGKTNAAKEYVIEYWEEQNV